MKSLPRILLFLFALTALLFLPVPALAQSGKTVTVKQRDANITIQANGDVQFLETWVVDFQRGGFTFAFREIPKSRLHAIVDVQVTEGAQVLRTVTDETEDHVKLTWYFPETNRGAAFFSDVHTFVLHYTVQGALRIYPDGDQFWWKFVEKDRAYAIESARATVHLPATFNPDQLRLTTYLNKDETGGGQVIDGSTIEFVGGPFPPQTEWEIRAQFPHTVTAPPAEWQVSEDRITQIAAQNNFYSVVIGVILLLGGPLLLLVLWYLFGRDKPTTFSAEFLNTPPDDTPPGVVGTLLDERADLQDIVATVADLARRGYLRIREGDTFGTPEYERLAKPDRDLAPFEKSTLEALLRGMSMRRLADVRGSFYYSINELQTALYNEVVARGFFPRSPFATRDLYLKFGKWGAVLTPLVGFCAYFATFTLAPLALFPLFALELFFIGLIGLSRVMPQRTPQGALAAAKWGAFRRYLTGIEKYTNVDAAQDQFSKYLPYTIAFGLQKSWIDKFKETSAPAPTWYVPYASGDDWTWRNLDTIRRTDESPLRDTDNAFRPGTLSPASITPIFSDSSDSGARRAERLPTLNEMANGSFLALNNVSSNMFDFLNLSADAFTAKPESASTTTQILDDVGGFLNWVGSSSGSDFSSGSSWSSSSDSSWSGSSSSSSSSSSGGGGGGGGSSGFG